MFFSQISDFEENFKFLDRLNILLFNVWKDDNASSFKNQSMEQLEMFYRNYVNEMRQKSHDMTSILEGINEQLTKLTDLSREMKSLRANPTIQGCGLGCAEGQLSENEHGVEHFIVPAGESPNDLEKTALSQCEKLITIDNAYYENSL